GGRLVACGADTASPAGVAHLAPIATLPEARGRGLGTAVTAWMTRRVLADEPLCTLAMYADNDGARRLYRRLGYREEAWLTSARFGWPQEVARRPPRRRRPPCAGPA
ncbi:MAG: GNAT family N-acetyltransferase, partial [Streptomycetales bacterium]